MRNNRVVKLIFVLALMVLTIIGCMVTASADDIAFNPLRDEDAGFRLYNGSFTIETDEDGNEFVYNAGDCATIYAYDDGNVMGSHMTFSLEADVYFDAFPEGLRDGQDTPKDNPLSFLCWIYSNVDTGSPSVFNGLRIDDEGYLYTSGKNAVSKTDIQLRTDTWYNIRCVFTPRNGVSELFIDGEKMLDFKIETFRSSKYKSHAVRYFDGYYNWKVKMKNCFVKTDSSYLVELKREESADYLGYQVTKPEGNSFSARAILGLNGLDHKKVGYEILMLSRDEEGTILTESLSTQTSVVYESVLDANGTTYSAKDAFGYNYLAALTIDGLPKEAVDGMYELVIRPYVLGNDGVRRYGIASTLYYTGEIDSNGYPVLVKNTGQSYEIPCIADTYIWNKDGYRDKNLGSEGTMMFRNPGSYEKEGYRAAYFKFTLDAENVQALETAASAKLKVYIPRVDGNENRTLYDITVHATGTGWDEHSLNYNTAETLAAEGEFLYQAPCRPTSYFTADVLEYLKSQPLNADGSLTVSFRVTNEGHSDALECYISSKESSFAPVIEISHTLYEVATTLNKMNNTGYEPWGYAKVLVDEWFDELYDEIYPKDGNGDLIYYEIDPLAPEGYGEKTSKGDFTETVYWLNNGVWTTNAAEGYKKDDSYWRSDCFARTLSTLGTSTANAFLDSSYAEQTSEYDSYGGLTNAGFTGTATGFFHTEKHGDRTYIIDPLGNPYFASGINDLSVGNTNQETYILEAFGTKENFFNQMTADLRSMGINTTFVSDNASVLGVENGLASAVGLEVVSHYMALIGRAPISEGQFPYNNTMNVFDPDFVKVTNENVADQIAKGGYAELAEVFGYTTDNELPSAPDLLSSYLTLNPNEEVTNAFSYAVAWTWLARRMETPYPTLDEYLYSPDRDQIAQEFFSFVYARYYKVSRDAIMAADPNHMYLGSRVAGDCKVNEGYHRAAGHYLDIITVNLYDGLNPSAETITSIYRNSGKPFIVTEFYGQSLDAIDANGWMLASSHGAGAYMNTQAERAAYYENYVLALLESKACVGWIWYRFRDCDQSIFEMTETGEQVIMLHVTAGTTMKANTFMKEDGTIVSADEVGAYTTVYKGNDINSNQNGNKGLYNSDFSSVVSVYQYDAEGKLVSFKSYEVVTPMAEKPAQGTVLTAAEGGDTYIVGCVESADGGYTETVLTVYEGKYVALASSMASINEHIMGLIGYFDAE